MVVQKKQKIVITFDNDAALSLGEIVKANKLICMDFSSKMGNKEDNVLFISNPGEYEFAEVLIKVFSDNNFIVSSEMSKILYVRSIRKDGSYRSVEDVDIVVFDDQEKGDKYEEEQIIEIQKLLEPKFIFINKDYLSGNIEKSEEVDKYKFRIGDLTTSAENKIFIVK